MYSIKLVADGKVIFLLDFEGEEIEVAKCTKKDSGLWYIHSLMVPELAEKFFTSPEDALAEYKAYMQTISDEE
jgi:hypothetical protein